MKKGYLDGIIIFLGTLAVCMVLMLGIEIIALAMQTGASAVADKVASIFNISASWFANYVDMGINRFTALEMILKGVLLTPIVISKKKVKNHDKWRKVAFVVAFLIMEVSFRLSTGLGAFMVSAWSNLHTGQTTPIFRGVWNNFFSNEHVFVSICEAWIIRNFEKKFSRKETKEGV